MYVKREEDKELTIVGHSDIEKIGRRKRIRETKKEQPVRWEENQESLASWMPSEGQKRDKSCHMLLMSG